MAPVIGLVNFNLILAQLAEPKKEWRIVTSQLHSTVWDGELTLFDLNGLVFFKDDAPECFIYAAFVPGSEELAIGELVKTVLPGGFTYAREIVGLRIKPLYDVPAKDLYAGEIRAPLPRICASGESWVSAWRPGEGAEEKEKLQAQETLMGRNLDLEHCANKQEAVVAAYAEEFEENERKIVEGGAWANELGSTEDHVLVSHPDEILPQPPSHSKLEAGTGEHEEAEGPGGFLFLGLGLRRMAFPAEVVGRSQNAKKPLQSLTKQLGHLRSSSFLPSSRNSPLGSTNR